MRGKKIPGTREQVISAIQKTAKELGRAPRREELVELGGIPRSLVRRLFARYEDAVQAAGLMPSGSMRERAIRDEELLEDWGEVTRRLKRAAKYHEYEQAGKHVSRTLVERFGRWLRVQVAFVEAHAAGRLKGDWKDVLEMIARTPRGPVTKERWKKNLLMAVLRAHKVPEARKAQAARGRDLVAKPGLAAEGRALPPALMGMKCVTATMLTPLVASTVLGGGFWRRVLPDRPLLGPPMHAAGLTHEPVNEMGVSMLFAMLAPKLGFIIESVQPGFPDCRAKMEVLPGRWQEVRIEFEYESRSFVNHCHYPGGCDMIVCWKHNWKGCPKGMMVLELRRMFDRA